MNPLTNPAPSIGIKPFTNPTGGVTTPMMPNTPLPAGQFPISGAGFTSNIPAENSPIAGAFGTTNLFNTGIQGSPKPALATPRASTPIMTSTTPQPSPIYSQPNNGVYAGGSSSLPAEGTPEYVAAQNAYNSSRNFPPAPPFSINTTNPNGNISGSTVGNTGSNYNSAVNSYNDLAGIASKVFDYSQYSPEELQAKQNLADLNSKILAQKFAATTQINDLAQNGALTKEQAQAFINETSRRADEQSALLGISQNAAANTLGVLTSARQTTLGAYQNLAGLLQPTSVAPGSTLYNPITGTMYQGSGAAPATIASLAQQMAQTDQQYGSMITNPDGSVNYQAYYQKAQSFIDGQNPNTVGGLTQTGNGNMQNQIPTYGTQEGNQYYASPQFASQLPPAVYPAKQTTSTGATYFDSSKLDQTGIGVARKISQITGIPIIDGTDSAAVKTTDQAIKNLKLLQANFNSLASDGVGGALWQNFTDPISGILQTSRGSALTTYNNNRDGLLQQIRALAGSSPRINSQELNLATNALPTLSEFNKDTVQTGTDKVNTVMGHLNNAMTTLVPGYGGQSGQATGQTVGGQTGTSRVVQTKAGAINTDW